jgi:hypothetical protein
MPRRRPASPIILPQLEDGETIDINIDNDSDSESESDHPNVNNPARHVAQRPVQGSLCSLYLINPH